MSCALLLRQRSLRTEDPHTNKETFHSSSTNIREYCLHRIRRKATISPTSNFKTSTIAFLLHSRCLNISGRRETSLAEQIECQQLTAIKCADGAKTEPSKVYDKAQVHQCNEQKQRLSEMGITFECNTRVRQETITAP